MDRAMMFGMLAMVIEWDAFKAVILALGLVVIYASGKQGDGKMFRAAGVGRDFSVIYDADAPPPTLADDFPAAVRVDTIDPT